MKRVLTFLLTISIVLSTTAQTYKGLTADEWIDKAEQNYKKKGIYLKNAAMTGEAKGQFEYAEYLNANGKHKMALPFYEKCAAQDYAPVYLILAKIKHFKSGYPHNLDEAEKWYLKAADNNEDEAFYWLADIYKDRQRYTKAIAYFEKSANGKKTYYKYLSLVTLGEIYENGTTETLPDYEKAYNYYLAADVDENTVHRKQAQDGIARLKPTIDKIIAERNLPAMEKKYANSNNTEKLFELAVMYAAVEKLDKCFATLRKAAQLGHTEAMYHTGVLYHNGEGTAKDVSKAVYWYKKAAAKNNSDAMNMLAIAYYNGDGIPQDLKSAATYFKKAANLNHADACSNLAICYEQGTGVEKNMDEALKWYKKAADLGNETAANRYAELTRPSQTTTSNNVASTSTDKLQRRKNFWNKFADITEAAVTVMEGVGNIYETYHTQDDNTSASGYSSTGTYASSSSSGNSNYVAKVICGSCHGSGKTLDFHNGNSRHDTRYKDCKSHFCTLCYERHCLDHNLKHENCPACGGNGYNIRHDFHSPISSTCAVCNGSGYVRNHSYYPICNSIKCTQSSHCPLCGETHCLDHERHIKCPSCNGILGMEGNQYVSSNNNESYSASDNLNHVLGKCYYCDGTGVCQDCRDCYFVDSKGHRYGATEKYWFSNISKFVCKLCKGSKIDGNHRCTLCFEIVTAPDGSTWGMRNDVWKTDSSASGILCYTCDGTMKCVYCKGTGKR